MDLNRRKAGHNALKWNKEKQDFETFDPNPPMNVQSEKDDLNRELAELVGLCWHELIQSTFYCTCGTKYFGEKEINNHISKNNPDFAADPGKIQLLREMVKREDFPLFMARLMYMGDSVEGIDWDHNIDIDYILDTTGLLALAARDFMRKEKP